MADGEVLFLMEAQLKRSTNVVREMARRLGVNYARWPEVRELMDRRQVDVVELAEFLARCDVKEEWQLFGCTRYRVEGDDPSDRIISAIVSIHAAMVTVEVITLAIKEA